MKIAVSGTYSTGKTTMSLALSLFTGIPSTHARTMREILPTTFPGKRLEKCDFHELIELGIRRFSERIIAEQVMGNSFISDGCPLQEWLYGTTRMITGLNPSEKTWLIKLHKLFNASGWKTFEESLYSFGQVVKEYTKKHYDTIIHLPVEFPFTPDGHRPTSESFRLKSEEILLKTYDELGIKVIEIRGSLIERLNQVHSILPIVPQISPEEAAILAIEMRKQVFDNITLEKTSKN